MGQWFHSAGVTLLLHKQSVYNENGDCKKISADPQPGLNFEFEHFNIQLKQYGSYIRAYQSLSIYIHQ